MIEPGADPEFPPDREIPARDERQDSVHRRFPVALPWAVGALAVAQRWFGHLLASGDLGPTPPLRVFVPVLFWLLLAVGLLGFGVWAEIRGMRSIWVSVISFALACVGLAFAWNTLQGYLQVV